MCVPFDAEPPVAPIAGAAVSHDLLELEAADGNRLAAFAAMPEGKAEAGVVVIPDVRGLFHFYEELALRLAENGIATSASARAATCRCSSSASASAATTRGCRPPTRTSPAPSGSTAGRGAARRTRPGRPSAPATCARRSSPSWAATTPAIPVEDVEAFEQALSAAGADHEVVTHPGAPHSFFDRRFEEHA